VRALHAYPRLDVNEYAVPIPGLHVDLDGFTIVQVSDLHVGPGPWVPPTWEEAASVVRSGDADLVVNTGDFLQWEPPTEKARRVFERFLPGSGRGDDSALAVAILGNHDYFAGSRVAESLARELRAEGVQVLTNEVMPIQHGDAMLTVAGLTQARPGFDEAIDALCRAPRPRVVLVHWPDEAVLLPAGSADLVLAGHTHGGQVALPGLRPFIVKHFCKSDFIEGWYAVSDNRMYVNRGLGCTGYPVRFRSRPEVSIFRLRR
jgi:predicted MPP superfamily phosphohydrolase